MYPQKIEHDGLAILSDISWAQFAQLDSLLEADRSARLTYWHGVLEIMSPLGYQHENKTGALRLLVETWCRAKKLRFYIHRSTTLRKNGCTSAEPDESYCFGTDKEHPDLIIEVIFTSGSIDKLDVYQEFAVPEIWFWKQGKLSVYCLKDGDYRLVSSSCVLPELDLCLVEKCANMPDQYDALEYFESQL